MCLLNGKCICYVIHIVNDARIVRMAFPVSYFIQPRVARDRQKKGNKSVDGETKIETEL